VEEAARKANTTVEKIESWEAGNASPSVRQARLLADLYERGFLEFFLPRPPEIAESKLVPDFRLRRDASDPRSDRELQAIQSWAEEKRLNALDLFEAIRDQVPELPADLFATIGVNPEAVANLARVRAEFPIEKQLALTPQARALMPKLVRAALERLGILVLKEGALTKYGVRGLTIFAPSLPVIVFGAEAPVAQSFTMAHELGHIILQQSAISGPPSARDDATPAEAAERWCDQFAGAFLVPGDAMAKQWAKPNSPLAAIGDDTLGQLANTFAVSRHAMLIRLVHLGYVEPRYYWDVKRPEFLHRERDFKGGGIPKYYGVRYRSAHGDLYTGLVLEAWSEGALTNHNAAEFMGIKNLRPLFDVRDNFSS
jgi:Zn-dependent peptidase ImmA (M78 family)/transcriptional regulator with XRE-family HTH domain